MDKKSKVEAITTRFPIMEPFDENAVVAQYNDLLDVALQLALELDIVNDLRSHDLAAAFDTLEDVRATQKTKEEKDSREVPQDNYTRRPTAGPCKCGQHEVPKGCDGVQWYWQRHTREMCTLELPNEQCWCGLLRSEHITGHAGSGRLVMSLNKPMTESDKIAKAGKWKPNFAGYWISGSTWATAGGALSVTFAKPTRWERFWRFVCFNDTWCSYKK